MPPTHQSQIETAISRLPETAYGTARLAAADYRRILSDAQSVGDFNKAFENDANYDAGSDLANDMWAISNDTGLSLTPDFCFQDAPFLFHDALGSTTSGVFYAGTYQHTQVPQSMNTSRQLPSRTILKKYGGLGIYLFRSMVCTGLVVSGGKTGRVKMNATYKGDGMQLINPASYAIPAIVADREWGFSGQINPSIWLSSSVGTPQVETATVAGGPVSTAGTVLFTITSNYFSAPVVVSVDTILTNTAQDVAGAARIALLKNAQISARFIVGGVTTAVSLTDRQGRADDATLNIAISNGTSAGITAAPTSASTTPGVAGNYQEYACDIETWQVTLNNPAAADGYRACSPYLTAGVPESGSLRSEYLCGQREFMFEWTCRLNTGDKAWDWMNSGTNLGLNIPIVGKETTDHNCRITHDKARITEAKPITGIDGNMIGISGKASLMATSGAIGLSVITQNGTASYTT